MRGLARSRPRGADARAAASADRIEQQVAVALGVIACSLWVASGLHLAGLVHGRGAPFDGDHAGVAEALIGVVLAVAVAALWRAGPRARRAGLWATGFAVAGFCWGLIITSRGGHWPDITYHLVGLPLLVTCLVALLRVGRTTADQSGRQ